MKGSGARRLLLLFAILLVAAVALAQASVTPSISAQKQYHVTSYGTTLEVQIDGSLKIVERISFSFDEGSFSFAFRDIPWVGYDEIRDLRVEDENGQNLGFEFWFESGEYHVRWNYPPVSSPAERTFTITYSVTNALGQVSADRNRLDWQAVGPGWSVPVENVAVLVVLPFVVQDLSQIAHSPEPTKMELTEGTTVLSFYHSGLDPYSWYRVIVDFPKVVDVTVNPARVVRESPITVGFLGFIAIALGMAAVWFVRGREPRIDSPYGSVGYPSPPSGLTPEEVGCLIKQTVDTNATLAALISLGKKGYIVLSEARPEGIRNQKEDLASDRSAVPIELTKKGQRAVSEFAGAYSDDLPEQEYLLLQAVAKHPSDRSQRLGAQAGVLRARFTSASSK
jgi:hypothetical protein